MSPPADLSLPIHSVALKTAVAFLLLLGLLSPSSADELPADVSDPDVAHFENRIRPVLVQRCYSCHSRKAEKQEGELRLDNPDGWLRGGARGPSVVPGDPDRSLLLKAVRYEDPDLQMPPAAKLTDEEIEAITTWIAKGAKAPMRTEASGVIDPSDPVEGRSHWAFQPLSSSVPAVKNMSWPRSDIDRFVMARLEAEGLAPVEDARPSDLIRRVSFQLVGLPPSPEHRAAFVADPTPETLTRIVDELLASPQFGQRWGRHWLDLARFADSNGLDENFLFREAWRYRNWVIDAVNADLPFDRFLLEQLAGDLLPHDSIEQRDRQRIAAGFLVVGPKVLLGVNPDKQKMDVADEQLETIGKAVLGQTLGCARCHDHKFDPIPTADYYALTGILTSTRVMEQRYMLGEQRVMERLVGLGPDGHRLDDEYEEYWRERSKLKAQAEGAGSVLELLKQGDERRIAEKLVAEPKHFTDVARDTARALNVRLAAQDAFVNELNARLSSPPAIPPRAMIPTDAETPADEAIRLAGQYDNVGDKVSRGYLRVLCGETSATVTTSQSGRIELSQWLTNSTLPSGWLTARVQANRVWHHLLGRGIVRTVDNFGRTGEAPSHPELLDHLAQHLISNGWSLKSLIREIVLSRTFALSSQMDSVGHERDPDNRLLWRAHRRRLDPESLRDAMLTATGTLDLNPVESTVSYLGDQATAVGANPVRRRTDFTCRSVYLPVIRNDLPELFDVFDFANPHLTTGARPQTTVPTQGLYLLNDPHVMAAADAVADRILQESSTETIHKQTQRIFELVLARGVEDIQEDSRNTVLQFVQDTESRLSSSGISDARRQALAQACHALFASSQFQYLD
jgi:mono/diheme cytochrome c family protein